MYSACRKHSTSRLFPHFVVSQVSQRSQLRFVSSLRKISHNNKLPHEVASLIVTSYFKTDYKPTAAHAAGFSEVDLSDFSVNRTNNFSFYSTELLKMVDSSFMFTIHDTKLDIWAPPNNSCMFLIK